MRFFCYWIVRTGRSTCSHQTTKAENTDRVDAKKRVTRTEEQGGQGGVVNQRIEEARKAIEGKFGK